MRPADPPGPRIAIAGFFLEANRFAPVTTAADFAQAFDVAGKRLAAQLHAVPAATLPDIAGFVAGMSEAGPWQPLALRVAAAYPGGPAEQAFVDGLFDDILGRLAAAGPVDGVFLSSHGAALATEEDDPDGRLYARIRAAVGPQVPVVAVLDLHTNVSERMAASLSALVAYRSNPHVDLDARGREAAALMRRMLVEGPGEVVRVKLPFLPAATDQLIAPGRPYHTVVEEGQRCVGGAILNVSACGGFALADSPECGFSVVVTASHGQRAQATAVAQRLAERVWALRADFATHLTAFDDAVALAVASGRDPVDPPLILADVGDNPGGGGGGNATALLQALVDAGAQQVLLGLFCDAALAAEAHARGVGAVWQACFNRDAPAAPGAERWSHDARVLALSDGAFVGRKGLLRGSAQRMGPSALLELGPVRVAVVSLRQQLLDPAQLDALGVDLGSVRTLVVKSRGHFRAAFDDFTTAERIIEVDSPGLTTPVLRRLKLARVPRPIYPLDDDVTWPPPPPPTLFPRRDLEWT